MSSLKELVAGRYGIELDCGADMAAEGTLAGILSRGSQRHYTDDPVTDDLLQVLLACAQSAPTKSDLQQYSIIVVKDADLRQKLSDQGGGMDWPPNAPVFLVFCADIHRIRKLAGIRGHDHQNDNVDTFMNGIIDAAVAMQCFINAAEAAGLGTCPISQIRNKIDETCELLGLPEGVFPIAGLAVGWPKFPTPRISLRLPQSVVIHTDRYDESNMPADVGVLRSKAARAHPAAGSQAAARGQIRRARLLPLVGERDPAAFAAGTARVPGFLEQTRVQAGLAPLDLTAAGR